MKESKKKAKRGFLGGLNKTQRIAVILVSSLILSALVLGAVLGIVFGVRSSSYVMYYNGVGIDRGVTNYLISYYKNIYMQQLTASGVSGVVDNENFWSTVRFGQNTYGSDLKFSTESFLEQLIAANAVFDSYTTLTEADKSSIEVAVNEILSFRSEGLKSNFNGVTKDTYGFDFKDFEEATVLLYKAWAAKTKIFGESGELMGSYPDLCSNFYSGYRKVKLIFIRTEDTFVKDESGNRKKDEFGNDILVELTESERAERLEYISRLDACVEGINNGSVSPEQFGVIAAELLTEYDEFDAYMASGVYLHSQSSYTAELREVFGDLVSDALGLYEGEAYSVSVDTTEDGENTEGSVEDAGGKGAFVGKCYMLNVEKDELDLEEKDTYGYFDDFYANAARYAFQNMLNEAAELVEVRDAWAEIEPALIPYNYEYVARFV